MSGNPAGGYVLLRQLACLLLLLGVAVSTALAGPNAGGVLLVHDTGLAFSTDLPGPPYESPVPADCNAIDNQAPLGRSTDPRIWKVYAAFPAGTSPRLQALSWGVGLKPYGAGYVSVTKAGLPNAADFEVTMDGPGGAWPAADSSSIGESFPISGTKTSLMTEVYWFAGYAYGGPSGTDPQIFATQRHRVQASMFADDSSPRNSDPIAAFGTLGFGQPGTSPCPSLPPGMGACCAMNGACEITWQSACPGADAWHADWRTCAPNPCPQPNGACCDAAGVCTVTAERDCLAPSGWHSAWPTCSPGPCLAPFDGSIVAWGENGQGQCNVPEPNAVFVAVAAGGFHSLGLKSDGTVVAWGLNIFGAVDVPAPNEDFVAVAAGTFHSLGLKSDRTIVAWGDNLDGKCNVPGPNASFVAIAAGDAHSLGLKADGTIVAWGSNYVGQRNIPTPNGGFVAVSAGEAHSLGLKSDGTIVAWGSNRYGQCDVPAPNAGFVAVSAGASHSLGLRSDGTIVTWGSDRSVPSPNTGFVAVAAARFYSLGLRSDGTIVAWGANDHGQCDVPAPNNAFVAVSGGAYHSLGLVSHLEVAGACCDALGICALTLQAKCQSPSVWHGAGSSCTPNPCAVPPTPVLLESWTASSLRDGLQIRWEMPLGTTGARFRAWRDPGAGPSDLAPTPEAVLVSPTWISASAEGIIETMDPEAPRGATIRYFLEMSANGAKSEFIGPIEARWDPPAMAWSVGPTPFRGAVRFNPPGPGFARVEIFDPAGRKVGTIERADGNAPLEWDGRSDSGRDAPTGVYLVRLTSASGNAVKRLVKIE